MIGVADMRSALNRGRHGTAIGGILRHYLAPHCTQETAQKAREQKPARRREEASRVQARKSGRNIDTMRVKASGRTVEVWKLLSASG